MKTKHQVHNLIILDESGSMETIKKTIISGFNELVQTIKGIDSEFPEQEHLISLLTFNGIGRKLLHFTDPIHDLLSIDESKYIPSASTPLYDAMGFGLSKLRQHLSGKTEFNVLVTILTDGEENASKEYNQSTIKNLVEELKEERWTFTYIGADHDVEKFAKSLSIHNTMTFNKNDQDIRVMFEKEKSSRAMYSKKIRNNESTDLDFYTS